jgi:alpha-tubulin suppressor-like RCC1 family protein
MRWLTFISISISLFLFHCERQNDPISPADSNRRSATIFEPDGSTPAEGVLVRIYDINSDKNRASYTVATGLKGDYSLDGLPTGIYCLYAVKDSLVLFQDSLIVTPSVITLHNDTLEYPSSITGVIGIEEYDDCRYFTVQVTGLDMKPVTPDTSGKFTISGLASGTWPIMINSTLPSYLPTPAMITILTSSHNSITDTLFVYKTSIPFIDKITFIQDTLTGKLRLSWHKPAYPGLRDFLIYRTTSSSTAYDKPAFATQDSFCIDPIFSSLKADTADTAIRSLAYRIALRNIDGEIGPSSHLFSFQFAPRGYATTFMKHQVVYPPLTDSVFPYNTEEVFIISIKSCASIGDTVTISFNAHNRTRKLRRIFWYNASQHDTLCSEAVKDTLASEINDTLFFTKDSAGFYKLKFGVIDNAGTVWNDSVWVQFLNDAPDANAGDDQTVHNNDSIHLHGKATQFFGSIISWQWKIGFGKWSYTSGPDTVFPASSFRETVICSLAVMDDDSNRSFSEVKIDIITSMHITEIASGNFHRLFLNNKGVLLGSGLATSGQLGPNDSSYYEQCAIPIRIATDVLSMDGGDCHTLFVKFDGSSYACGWNNYGQLGDGTVLSTLQPVLVMTDVQQVAAGANHSLFLKTDSTLWACGNNQFGQAGDSLLQPHLAPVQIANGVCQITAGNNHSVIIKSDRTAWAFGLNDKGQLGDGTTINRPLPVQIMTDAKIAAAGAAHSLIIKSDGSLWTCGQNSSGQLGDNTSQNRSIPIKIMENVLQIAAGNYHSLILTTDGSLWACGDNSLGQIGDGTTVNRSTPVKIAEGVNRIAAGGWHSLMLKKDGTVWCWGWNAYDFNGVKGSDFSPEPIMCVP